jgi:putative peptidoglycan lipid II flippase
MPVLVPVLPDERDVTSTRTSARAIAIARVRSRGCDREVVASAASRVRVLRGWRAVPLAEATHRIDTPPVSQPAEQDERAGGAIARRAGIVAAGTLTSRVLGFARDVVLAAVFPPGLTDLFYVAFTIPNALRVLLRDGEDAARAYFARLTALLGLVLLAVSALGVLAAPLLVSVYATGYRVDHPERFEDTVAITRVVFPYIFFMGLAALGMGGLNALRRFAVPAFAPALLNVALIAAAFTLVGPAEALGLPTVGALALGALLGGALQLLAQWPSQRGAGLLRRPILDLRDPAVKKTLALMVPVLAGFGVYQLNTIVGRSLLSFLAEGAQSYIWYGMRVVEIPQGVFALAIAGASLPTLSDLRARGDLARIRELFGYSLRLTLFLGIPSTFLLAVLAEPIIAVGFGRGAFARADVLETAQSLGWQAAGVWGIASVRTVLPFYYAYNDTRTPVVASAVNLVVFTAVAAGLMQLYGHVGVAMALSAAGIAQLGTLLALLRRKVGVLGLRRVVVSALRIAVASGASAASASGVARLGDWSRGGNHLPNVGVLGAACVVAGLVYLLVARVLRAPELDDVLAAVRRRARR